MASPARPDRWPDLSGLGSQDRDGAAALLKVNAEMFVSAPARDREIIETFETLALGFLPMVSRACLVEIARILAPCEDTPASVLDQLSRQSPEAREIVLARAARLPSPINDKLLATSAGRLQIAGRRDLDATMVDRLLAPHEPEVEDRLAANPDLAPAEPVFAALIRRAKDRPSLAHILLQRSDLILENEAALYLSATRERKARIRDRMATAAAAQRVTLSFRLTEHDVCEFFDAARQGDARRLELLMNAAFGFPAATDWRCLQIGRHELLALALKALGLVEKEATRIFLTLHPALSYPLSAVKDLVRTVRDVPSSVALALVEAILGVEALSGRRTANEDAERDAVATFAHRARIGGAT
jgi:hypothetical protein